MNEEKIVLVQGAVSVRYLIERFGKEKIRRWIAYDAEAQGILSVNNISFVDESFYLNADPHWMNQIRTSAHQLSVKWFQDVPGYTGDLEFRFEDLSIRSFNYYFLSVLSAFYLLEKINEKEGECQLVTTREPFLSERVCLEDRKNKGLIPVLLEHFKRRWAFKSVFFDFETPVENISRSLLPISVIHRFSLYIYEIVSLMTPYFKKGGILFSGNPSLLSPVSAELEKTGYRCFTVNKISNLKQIRYFFNRHTLPLFLPQTSIKPDDFDEAAYWKAFHHKRTFQIDGIDYLPIVWERIRQFYQWEAPRLKRICHSAKALLNRVKPRYVVVDEDVIDVNRALMYVAKTLGIKTLVVCHGLPGDRFGFVPLIADHIAVWGDYIQQTLASWNVTESRMVVTGCPKYDDLNHWTKGGYEQKKIVCKRFGWSLKSPIVLIVPGGLYVDPFGRFVGIGSTSSEIFKCTDYFLRIARELPHVNFIYKFRSGVNGKNIFKELIEKYGGLPSNMKWIERGVATEYMALSDLIFNSCSSAGLEAILLKRPLVNMNFSFHLDVFPFVHYGLQASVRTFEEGLNMCRSLGEGSLPFTKWLDAQEKLIFPFVCSRDGKAAARIAEFMRQRL